MENFTAGTDRSQKKGKQSTETTEEPPVEEEKKSTWTMTYPSGERVKFAQGSEQEELKAVMICQASDPETSQVNIYCSCTGQVAVSLFKTHNFIPTLCMIYNIII